ncbi:hypothetical protein [Paenirhodobacter sp.]|uniref:hypothetical protein n=1 Tax=Paenirhodobacter sp. TaxID=1965326 RepID=UPI003B418CC8
MNNILDRKYDATTGFCDTVVHGEDRSLELTRAVALRCGERGGAQEIVLPPRGSDGPQSCLRCPAIPRGSDL